MHISEMKKKSTKSLFVFEIMAFELVREIVHIATGILVVGSQRVYKQS